MGLKNLAILTPAGRTEFFTGEILHGCLEIEVDEKAVQYIELSLIGTAHVEWSEFLDKFSSDNTFFSETKNFTNYGLPFTQGKHKIPFEFNLQQ